MNASHSRVRSTDERFDLPLASQTINGKSCPSPTSFAVVDPATGLPFAQSPDATRQQLNDAVEAARQAQTRW
ncbi:MAG: aldehyde dehydrogenase family protein, partial [Pigmentiphaga sp.]|nr:aldehyde dehydrogenase family protein [Pigmentiphaga sp.]